MATQSLLVQTEKGYGSNTAYCLFSGKEISQILGHEAFEKALERQRTFQERGSISLAYVEYNDSGLIQAVVLFKLPLDDDGHCVEGWHMPLQRLAHTAGRGPNLGSGRIRLACRSQCSISWLQPLLWDPTPRVFANLKHVVAKHAKELPDQSEVNTDFLIRQFRNETAGYRNELQQLQQELEQQRLLNERLLNKLNTQPVNTTAESMSKEERIDHHVLRQKAERQAMRIRELEVTNEKLRESQSQTDEPKIVEAMQHNEVMSVVFHPGAGHINLSPYELIEYLQDPKAYAAHYLGMSKFQYGQWLKHYESGCCEVCDDKIAIIADPQIFDAEVDIYCETHKPLA